MSGMIFFGMDELTNKSMHSLINGYYWDAFGDLIDFALEKQHPNIHKIIKSEEAVALSYYYFDELDEIEFRIAVEAIRDEISKWKELNTCQQMAKQVWENTCEPWILRDKRYKPWRPG